MTKEKLKRGCVVKVQFKEGEHKHFKFMGYGRDFRKMMQMTTVRLNDDCKVLIGIPLGRTNKMVINGNVVPEMIPLENIINMEVIDESQNKIFEDVL